jgi:hypothetical protein
MNPILSKLRSDLKKNADAGAKKSFQRFFREEAKFYGVKTGTVGKISKWEKWIKSQKTGVVIEKIVNHQFEWKNEGDQIKKEPDLYR